MRSQLPALMLLVGSSSKPLNSAAWILIAAVVLLAEVGYGAAQDKQFSSTILTEAVIGDVPQGKYELKASVTTIAPHGSIPFHVHQYPGLRYVLEGAITVQWKDRGSQTFGSGSTYYEGAGANHPTEGMAATNPLAVPMRLLIVELVPLPSTQTSP
jgi:quercetin dioxygenase-like cupin family protein